LRGDLCYIKSGKVVFSKYIAVLMRSLPRFGGRAAFAQSGALLELFDPDRERTGKGAYLWKSRLVELLTITTISM
jgi:hypothetical protein